jgi:glucose-6-phosphate isomerase
MSLIESCAWKALQEHFNEKAQHFVMKELFANDASRFETFSEELADPLLFVDFSKNLITEETLELLLQLAKESGIEEARDLMFRGFPINSSEGRAVLHTALRGVGEGNKFSVRNEADEVVEENVLGAVEGELGVMRKLSESVRSGHWKGFTGKTICHVVNIGIGGSDLGPLMVSEALKGYLNEESEDTTADTLNFHFVSNVDGTHLASTLKKCCPERTLFVVVSKTFTTAETMRNAQSARDWLLNAAGGDSSAIAKHFVAVSTNAGAVEAFGIDAVNNCVKFWDWVGGRYSLWSGVGLSIMIQIGYRGFCDLLAGARHMDEHFQSAPLRHNLPVLMGLLGVWYNNFWGCQTTAVLPYEQALARFPAYLQQADMESNGKGVDRCTGEPITNYQTGAVVWGEPGTNGQHAFFQLIHQGTRLIPCDFLAGIHSIHPQYENSHHPMLLANFLAQTEALMIGKSIDQVAKEHVQSNQHPKTTTLPILMAQKTFPGNRPSTSIIYNKISPKTLGALIALYEHKIFVQGTIWRINSFDQWGVELGKQLASTILKELLPGSQPTTPSHDQSTQGLLNFIKLHRSA